MMRDASITDHDERRFHHRSGPPGASEGMVGDGSVPHRQSSVGGRRKARRKSLDRSVGGPSEGSVGTVRRKASRKSSDRSVGSPSE
eukprot:gene5584-biopygen6591